MKPLRIVLVMVEPPLPFGNAAARWYYVLLKGLVERGHRVTAFAACSRPDDIVGARALFPEPTYDLRPFPVMPRTGLLGKWLTLRQPLSYLFSDALKDDLRSVLAQGFDVLHLEQIWGGWVGLDHIERALINVQYLLEIDQAGQPPPSLRERVVQTLAVAAERRLVRAFHHIRTCTPRLQDAIRRINPGAALVTSPFGLELSFYPFLADEDCNPEPLLSLIGTMHWGPSYSAAVRLLTRLWPEIKRRVPRARLQIIGWRARSMLAASLDLPDVEVIENVPDTKPYFNATCVFLYAPGRGSGMKIKIMEAMAYGVPVVTTGEGIEGLDALDGVHAGVCDDDAGLIDRTVELLGDAGRRNRQRHAARRLIETCYTPGPTLDAMESIYARMLGCTDP
jgi:glycosyltransferase involved in cell wall biosynthesis